MVRGAVLAGALLLVGSAPAAEPEPILFTVQRGDTLIGLSQRVFVSDRAWHEVARLNRLPDPNRIRPGQVLRVPPALMRSTATPVRVLSTTGEVRSGEKVLAPGATLAEGERITTAANASAVIEWADGSRMRMPPSSLAEVIESRRYGPADEPGRIERWFAGAMRLLRGSVEVLASKLPRAKPLEVQTPTAVAGVRGTEYRVHHEDERSTRSGSEVLDGAVRFERADRAAGTDLVKGFGASIEAGAAAPSVAALAPAPDLASMPPRFERPLVRFALPDEKSALRVQVAADPAFERIVDDLRVEAGSDVRIAGLADGDWRLRARRVDARGIEGYDATATFTLKARPEPPAPSRPRSDAKQPVGAVEFAWLPNIEAASSRLQVARDEGFQDLVFERDGLGTSTRETFATAGRYFWRLASTRADGDRGPFGDPQRFEVRPDPTPPSGGVAEDGRSLALRWDGRAEDTHHVELARDPAFTQIIAQADLDRPEWKLPLPADPGTYYFRYRSIESDGYVGPNSTPLVLEVPRRWDGIWWLLLPLLLGL
jgi:hypothetical protein